jgi:hypothetical protein
MWYAPCPFQSLMEWAPDGVAVVLFPVLSAAAGYLLDGAHVQDIARAFAKSRFGSVSSSPSGRTQWVHIGHS